MPIPTKQENESKDEFISRCVESDQPQQFVDVHHVPIVHEIVINEHLTLSTDRLQQIVNHQNELFGQQEFSCLTVGHTDSEDRECIGLIDHFELGDYKGKPTIFADFHLYKGNEHYLKKYPRRSIEVSYTKDLSKIEIPTVALLGGLEPHCDLGLLLDTDQQISLAAQGKLKITRLNTFNDTQVDGEPMAVSDELRDQILEVIKSTDFYAWYEAQVATQDEEQEPEHKEELAEEPKEETAEPTAEDEHKPADDKPEEKEDDKLSRLSAQNTELLAKLRQTEREKALMLAAQEGYAIDVHKEVTRTKEMDDSNFQIYFDTLKEYCRKAPVGKKFDLSGIDTSPARYPNASELKEAQNWALDNRKDIQDGLKHFGFKV